MNIFYAEGSEIMTKEFWIAAGLRALRTFCQSLVGCIGTAAVLAEVNWPVCLSAAALSAIVSLLTSTATGLPEVNDHD